MPPYSSAYKSCDRCRSKRIKCAPNSSGPSAPCMSCARNDVLCTFDKGYKKPGRPSLERRLGRASSSKARSIRSSPEQPPPTSQSPANHNPSSGAGGPVSRVGDDDIGGQVMPDTQIEMPGDPWSHQFLGSDPGPSMSPLFTFLTDDGRSSLHAQPPTPQPLASTSQPTLPSTEPLITDTVFPTSPVSPASQIEDVAPWPLITFFLKLYLGYMHSLFPMVHKPSFFQAVALRTDQGDRNMRALILALVAYTIGQAPLSRQAPYGRDVLERLQRRCHRASMVILDRSYKATSLEHVGTLMANYFVCQSRGQVHRALALLAEACQLTYLLRLHDADSPGANVVERELRRRIFWHVYAVDITEACAGNMIHLNDFEGLPPLPLVVDDELITTAGAFDQPSQHDPSLSYMSGFVGCVQLFPLLSEVITRSRRLMRRNRELSQEDIRAELAWETDVTRRADAVIEALPLQLRADWLNAEGEEGGGGNGEGKDSRSAILGMQRANIFVTDASLRISLLDYVSEISPSEDITAARSSLARRAYEALSSFPLGDLAANGESIRGKIFRIVLVLLKAPDMDSDWVDMVQNWWSLFSRVNFLQLGPPLDIDTSESD